VDYVFGNGGKGLKYPRNPLSSIADDASVHFVSRGKNWSPSMDI